MIVLRHAYEVVVFLTDAYDALKIVFILTIPTKATVQMTLKGKMKILL